jgi:trk system potassium uptake protein TrkA
MAEGQNIIELSDILRGEARIFSFMVTEAHAVRISALSLPESARAICIYRNQDELMFASADTRLKAGDEVILLTRASGLQGLRKRFGDDTPPGGRSRASG